MPNFAVELTSSLARRACLSAPCSLWSAGSRDLFRGLRRQPLVRKLVLAVILVAVTCGTGCADPLVRVYAVRGFAGVVFSRGMNKLCEELEALPQVACTVEEFYSESEIKRKASIAVAAGQKVVFVGHSWGANVVLQIAAAMPGNVPLVVTIDPNWFPAPPTVPNNAEIVLNYYQDFDMLGRAALTAAPGYRGKLLQFVRREPHVLIDASPDIHAEVFTRIQNIVAGLTPVPTVPSNPSAQLPVGRNSINTLRSRRDRLPAQH